MGFCSDLEANRRRAHRADKTNPANNLKVVIAESLTPTQVQARQLQDDIMVAVFHGVERSIIDNLLLQLALVTNATWYLAKMEAV